MSAVMDSTQAKMLSGYSYKMYCAIFQSLEGKTIHWTDGLFREHQYSLLSKNEFEKLRQWLISADSIEPDGPDEMESLVWQLHETQSKLLVYEFNKYIRIHQAIHQ